MSGVANDGSKLTAKTDSLAGNFALLVAAGNVEVVLVKTVGESEGPGEAVEYAFLPYSAEEVVTIVEP
jgi:hypothetical protein